MRVFVTGASGFIGSAVVPELLGAGHQVLGLARSEASAASLTAAGAEVHRGALDDLESLRAGAARSDAVVHLAFIHDFTSFDASLKAEFAAVEAIGDALVGSGRPFAIASGLLGIAPGRLALEADAAPPGWPRGRAEEILKELAAKGVRTSAIRLPPTVHGAGDHGFVHMLIEIAKAKRAAAYLDEGQNRWSAVHRKDAARLFRLAIERAPAGSTFHGAAEEGVRAKEIATAIGAGLGVPVVSKAPAEAAGHFDGFLGTVFGMDAPTSSAQTRAALGWQPEETTLLDDIAAHYFR